jgi:hypothetical protein
MKRSRHILLAILASISLNVHALCVNPDGSLDDASVPDGSVAKEMLPACEAPKPAETQPAKPEPVAQNDQASTPTR